MKTTTTNNAVQERREERNCYHSVEETSIVAVDELTTEKPRRKEKNIIKSTYKRILIKRK